MSIVINEENFDQFKRNALQRAADTRKTLEKIIAQNKKKQKKQKKNKRRNKYQT